MSTMGSWTCALWEPTVRACRPSGSAAWAGRVRTARERRRRHRHHPRRDRRGGALLDTGDFHGTGHNEWLFRQALRPGGRDRIALSVKSGVLRAPDGTMLGLDNRPVAVRNFLT
ncbi:hypothetical protein GCM10020295_03670 [Streptomyces cinereospinus]